MPQHSLELVDEVAEPAVADADLSVCEAGREPTKNSPACSMLPQWCR